MPTVHCTQCADERWCFLSGYFGEYAVAGVETYVIFVSKCFPAAGLSFLWRFTKARFPFPGFMCVRQQYRDGLSPSTQFDALACL